MEVKKINQIKKKEIINYETGELLIEEKDTSYSFEREPDYIKIYLQDIIKLNNLPKSLNNILNSILKRTDYDNEIILIADKKKKILKELNIKAITLDVAITSLTKKKILIRRGRGVYILNPHYFGRGKWKDIQALRMTITYDKNKGRTIELEQDYQKKINFNEQK